MLADQLDYVIGVDPHRDAHAVAVVETRTAVVVFEATVSADTRPGGAGSRSRAPAPMARV